MRYLHVTAPRTGRDLAARAELADTFVARLRGLLGKPLLRTGEGILLTPCNAVHMWGMKYPIDVAFLDSEGVVMAMYEGLPPGGRTRRHRGARYALEVPVRTLSIAGVKVGDPLRWSTARDHLAARGDTLAPEVQ